MYAAPLDPTLTPCFASGSRKPTPILTAVKLSDCRVSSPAWEPNSLFRAMLSAESANKADFNALIQRIRDPAQHCQRVTFIIGVLKAANNRCCGADELGKLSLGEA